jgi:small subunit ribosomal protein S9
MDNQFYATGRRKEAVARVFLKAGKGEIVVNTRTLKDYFGEGALATAVKQPLLLTQTLDKYDVRADVHGGGVSGQAGAVRHGIARALLKTDEKLRQVLRKHGLLTRDPRMKERKKYGQKGARARFQFSKR